MAKILCDERVVEYSNEFKVKIVQLTHNLDVSAIEISEALGLHPVMVYRWRLEYKNGLFTEQPTRRISMSNPSKPKPKSNAEAREIKRLKREVEKLEKENDFLKKWERYLKEQKQNDSDL